MYRSLNYQEFLFTNMVRRLKENALVLFQPMHNEAEQICYNSRKALGSDIQITEERLNSLMCKKWLLARSSVTKSFTTLALPQ